MNFSIKSVLKWLLRTKYCKLNLNELSSLFLYLQAPGHRCSDCHLHYCSHVLRPSQLCGFPSSRKIHEGQTPAVCQWLWPSHLLASQLYLGHGEDVADVNVLLNALTCVQLLNMVSPFLCPQLNYLVPATCCVIILFVFDLPAYTSPTNFPAVLSLFLLYGWDICLHTRSLLTLLCSLFVYWLPLNRHNIQSVHLHHLHFSSLLF